MGEPRSDVSKFSRLVFTTDLVGLGFQEGKKRAVLTPALGRAAFGLGMLSNVFIILFKIPSKFSLI